MLEIQNQLGITMASKNHLFIFLGIFLLLGALAAAPQKPDTASALMGAAFRQEEVEGNLEMAIATYRKVLGAADVTRALAAKAQLRIGICYQRLGKPEARAAYELVLQNYKDQREAVQEARKWLDALSQAKPKPGVSTNPIIRQIKIGKEVGIPGPPSPDSRYLAYVDRETSNLAILDQTTGESRRLSEFAPKPTELEMVNEIVWAPKGDRIAYTWQGTANTRRDLLSEVRIVTLGTQGSRSIFSAPNWDLYLGDWTPDGTSVLASLAGADEKMTYALISAADGSLKPLKTFEELGKGWFGKFVLSPDGRFVTYEHKTLKEGDFDIYLFPINGGNETPVVRHGANDRLFGWTPDGQRLLFASDRRGSFDLWQIRIMNGSPQGDPELIKPELGAVDPLAITRNGACYYARKSAVMRDVFTVGLDIHKGQVLSPPVRVHPSEVGRSQLPAWSPDGRFLAYLCGPLSEQQMVNRLCVWSTEDQSHRRLDLSVSIYSSLWLSWSRDGSEILGPSVKDRKLMVWRIDPATGKVLGEADPAAVAPGRFNSANKQTPGRAAFSLRKDPATGIFRVYMRDREGAEKLLYQSDRPLSSMPGSVGVSPDGCWLALLLAKDQPNAPLFQILLAIPDDGGEARELWRRQAPEPGILNAIGWAPDGKAILCMTVRPEDSEAVDLWKVSVPDGTRQKLELSMPMRNFAFQPGGNLLAFTGYHTVPTEVWALENILRPSAGNVENPKAAAPKKK